MGFNSVHPRHNDPFDGINLLRHLLVIGGVDGDLGVSQPLDADGLPLPSPKLLVFQKVRSYVPFLTFSSYPSDLLL